MENNNVVTGKIGIGKICGSAGIESRGVDTLFATTDTDTEEALRYMTRTAVRMQHFGAYHTTSGN